MTSHEEVRLDVTVSHELLREMNSSRTVRHNTDAGVKVLINKVKDAPDAVKYVPEINLPELDPGPLTVTKTRWSTIKWEGLVVVVGPIIVAR